MPEDEPTVEKLTELKDNGLISSSQFELHMNRLQPSRRPDAEQEARFWAMQAVRYTPAFANLTEMKKNGIISSAQFELQVSNLLQADREAFAGITRGRSHRFLAR